MSKMLVNFLGFIYVRLSAGDLRGETDENNKLNYSIKNAAFDFVTPQTKNNLVDLCLLKYFL